MKLRFLLPLFFIAGMFALFALGLRLDPHEIPSPLIGKPAPEFNLPTLEGKPATLNMQQLRGQPVLVNFWASWCAGCKTEHAFLLELAQQPGVNLVGVNYKDEADAAKKTLAQEGNPYALVAVDHEGKAGLDWGVYGVPETFVLDSSGVIVYKQIGPMTAEAWQIIQPMLK